MRSLVPGLIVAVLAGRLALAAELEFSPQQLEFFENKVRPLLVERCHKCHGATEQKGNLRLDSRAAILQGGDTGPAIDLAQPQASELLLAVNYDPSGYQMPPDGKLPDEELATLRKWVEQGAPWPVEAHAGPDAGASWEEQFAQRMQHWSFQPLERPPVPVVDDADWCRNPVDRFVASKRLAAGLIPAEETDRPTWLRRAAFDSVGLPPSPADVDAFVRDPAPDAQERVIDRLLASPHFGERWGRHWLDLVRYAESRGHEFDYDVANPWPYRDYVIRALNADVPYDQFVVEHVAGDLLSVECSVSSVESDENLVQPPVGQTGRSTLNTRHPLRLDPATGANESIVGTGFWFLGEWVHSPVDIRQEEAERFANMIDVYSKTFLGLTVACARCHDHKFDPIPQTDFYALQGYLQSSSYQQLRYETLEHNRRIAAGMYAESERATTQLLHVFAELVQPFTNRLDQYLLAVVEVVAAVPQPTRESAAAFQAACGERSRVVAELRQLDPAILRAWVEHILSAADEADDPFYVWAQYAVGRWTDVSEAARPALLSQQEVGDPDWYTTACDEQRVLLAESFRSVDGAFVLRVHDRPIVRLSTDAERPVRGLEASGFYDYVPEVGDLPLAANAMQDPAKLADLGRAGRTLVTPTIEIARNRLYCLVRGSCHTYAAVDSHVTINGPLHGSLLQDHPAPAGQSDTWRWVEHDVSRYVGHRAHVEIVPRRGELLSVGMIVNADRPPVVVEPPTMQAWDVLPATSWEEVARSHRDCWALPIHLQQFAQVQQQPLERADWACRHPDLFGLSTPEARRRFAAVAQPLIERRSQLQAELQGGSHLAPVMLDGSGEDEYLFIRGNWKKPGDIVPRRFLSAFSHQLSAVSEPASGTVTEAPPLRSPLDTPPSTHQGSGRLALAEQMVDPQQTPILARVIVNRIWQHYLGRGIVPTPDDFGHLGLPPSHPELLDWLACELVDHDWSLKHIHRLILSSATYRMASESVERRVSSVESEPSAEATGTESQHIRHSTLNTQHSTDPGNTLLYRMNVKRLEGEILRDAILSLSGRLDDTLYGPSVPVHLTEFMEGRGRPKDSGPVDGAGRRSLYISVRRNFPDPFFQAFDFPNPHSTTGRRNVSNVPAQALALLNNPLVLEQSRVAARKLIVDSPDESVAARITQLYQTAFGRSPMAEEIEAGSQFLDAQAAALGVSLSSPRVWADYIHVLMNAKEFQFIR